MSKKIQMVVSPEQAHVLQGALELYTRLGLGQFEYVGEVISSGHVTPKDDILNTDCLDEINEHLIQIKELMGHSFSSSYGVSSKQVSKHAKSSYEINKLLGNALAEIEGTGVGGIRSGRLGFRVTDDELPQIVIQK